MVNPYQQQKNNFLDEEEMLLERAQEEQLKRGESEKKAKEERKRELKKRILSSMVILPLIGVCLYYGHWFFNGLILCVMMGLVWEGETLLKVDLKSIRGGVLLLWPVCTALAFIQENYWVALFLAVSALIFGVKKSAPIFVAILGGISLIWLRARPYGMEEVLFVLACVIVSDSCAFFTGRLIGGRKLAPKISPGKTISGSLGGILGALLIATLIAYLVNGHLVLEASLIGAFLAIATQIGDLFESGFKRRIGVKDSGKLIPGHGGLLDRLDGLLLAAPLAAFLAFFAKRSFLWLIFSS